MKKNLISKINTKKNRDNTFLKLFILELDLWLFYLKKKRNNRFDWKFFKWEGKFKSIRKCGLFYFSLKKDKKKLEILVCFFLQPCLILFNVRCLNYLVKFLAVYHYRTLLIVINYYLTLRIVYLVVLSKVLTIRKSNGF